MSDPDRNGTGSSYLVRLWREPRYGGAGEEPSRVFLRDLRSGEERYFTGLDGLTDYLDTAQGARGDTAEGSADGAASSRRRAG